MPVLHLLLGGHQLKYPATFDATVVVGLVLVNVKRLLTSSRAIRWRDSKVSVDHQIETILTLNPDIAEMNAFGLSKDPIFMECDWFGHTILWSIN